MDRILENKPSIQVHCFLKDPTAVEVESGGEQGMHIPGTLSYRCEMSNPRARLIDMRLLRSTLVNSLRQGDNAYVHCVSGISRAPMATAVICSLLMNISLNESQRIINSVRNVNFQKSDRMEGEWIECIIKEGVMPTEVPTGFSCCTARRTDDLVHATTLANGVAAPICRRKEGAVTEPQTFKGSTLTVDSIEEASNQFGGKFCGNCRQLVKASLKLKIDELF